MKESIKIPEGVGELEISCEDGRVIIEFAPRFKEGDFVYEDRRIMIIHKYPHFHKALVGPYSNNSAQYNSTYALPFSSHSFRFATEEEKKFLLNALEKDGKKWNAEKLCIEDIPQRKFKPGDKVKLKDGMLDKSGERPYFTAEMVVFIGKVLTVKSYTSTGYIFLNEAGIWEFAEAWLEPYSSKPEVGELAIFWDSFKERSKIGIYKGIDSKGYRDHYNIPWFNAVKFESKEQFVKHIKE